MAFIGSTSAIIDSFFSFTVIYAAYAAVDPQQAFNYSQGLSDYGSGNSASNQLYFIATRSSSSDICSANLQTPQGIYYIQDSASGNYVAVSTSGTLAATASGTSQATAFDLAFMPGGGSIMSLSNNQYVTADPNGQSPLAAARTVASTYETFRWIMQGDGSYEIEALVNRLDITSTSSGLVNNANSTNGVTPGTYKLVKSGASVAANAHMLASVKHSTVTITTGAPLSTAAAAQPTLATKSEATKSAAAASKLNAKASAKPTKH